jgi:hypothetical protein
MRKRNTFTYKQSEIPDFRPEIKSEIVALDVQIADLILRCQGNYHELEQLAEVLDNCADSCELNLNSIQVISDSPDDEAEENGISDLCRLSERSKAVVYSTGIASGVAVNLLCQATGGSDKVIKEMIATLVRSIVSDVSPDKIDEALKQLSDQFDGEILAYEIKLDRK